MFWLDEDAQRGRGGHPVMLTRLHVRYTPETFPEDLMFQETSDRANFQARYVLRHPWSGERRCVPGGEAVLRGRLRKRQEREAQSARPG